MQSFWKYVLTVAALAVSLAMAVNTEANPHMQQHRKLGALNRGASGLSRTILSLLDLHRISMSVDILSVLNYFVEYLHKVLSRWRLQSVVWPQRATPPPPLPPRILLVLARLPLPPHTGKTAVNPSVEAIASN